MRVIVGMVLIALMFVGPQTPWGAIGIIPLVTGLLGICPLYSLLGLRLYRHSADEGLHMADFRRSLS